MAPINIVITVVVLFVLLMAMGTIVYIVYTSTRDAYRNVQRKIGEHYSFRAKIKRWEEEELCREVPRDWMGTN